MSRNRRNQAVEEEVEEDGSSSALGEQESGMLAMLRLVMEEQRRAEVAREERKEEARIEREAEANRRLLEQQAAIEQRQYDQQTALIKLQAEIGEKATMAYREGQSSDRKRDRALFSVPVLREGDDVEEFLVTAEGRLKVAEVGMEEWIPIINSRLSGKLAVAWQDVTLTVGDYQEAKDRFLKMCGYTPMLAADRFYGFKLEHCKGLTADQLYHKGQQLLRRMIAPGTQTAEVEYAVLKGWVGSLIPKRARVAIDARVITSAAELVNALQDFLVLEGDRCEGQAATFKYKGGEASRERGTPITCFKCGKVGHKAVDCWKGGASVAKGGATATVGVVHKIICYNCGEEGHKSPQCPKLAKQEKEVVKGARPKPVKRVWHSQPKCVQLMGVVDKHATPILLDSGAAISVVPESLVAPERLAGGSVAVKPFGAKKPILLPIANVSFKIADLEWVERVAVPPEQEGAEEEVLYSLDLQSERGLKLVLMVNEVEPKEVLRVTTRAQAKSEREEQAEEALILEQEVPKPVSVESTVICAESEISNKKEVVGGSLGRKEEELKLILGLEKDTYADEKEEVFKLRKEKREEPDLVVPLVKAGTGDRAALVSETKADPSLRKWRELADKGEKGFLWENGLLYQAITTHVLEVAHLMVLPKEFRNRVLSVAHDKMQHMGARRVTALVRQHFVWPGMEQDIIQFCRSCPVCQTCSKQKARKVPMVERCVMSEPFESMAFDIVGPFPKGKGGCKFLLTAVCMASRWPEAIPLRTITAKAVSVGMMEIFARTGIPLQLISDQGAQFVGALVSQLCKSLHIDRIQTTPYHSEGNGVVERMHGTLGAMLTKAAKEGLDWVGQVPFALFALRAAPNRDTLFSPFELVMGRKVRTPLDIMHQGWAQVDFEQLDTDEWAEWLVGRLECWHDVMRDRGKDASKKRKKDFDKKSVERVLEEGDLVLCRVPGMTPKLQEAWHGPYPVKERLNQVDYRVELGKGRCKVLHINNMKRYQIREEEVMRLSVVAEDFSDDEEVGVKLEGRCDDFDESQVEVLQGEYPDVFNDVPGRTEVCSLEIVTGATPPIASGPYRVPDRMKEEVKKEVEKLLELGVAEPSHSPWASPIVPVLKKDGSIRLCIDYRKLNSVTAGDPYYMVTLEEILEKVGNSRCLSKLDLSKGFYQIGIEEGSREKTAFITPFGKYCFNRMPFGLRNAPAIFQRGMEVVLRGCYDCASPYIDDILVFSVNGVEHLKDLRRVLEALRKGGMTVKRAKCEFGRSTLEYLGHQIGNGTLAVPRHRAAAMNEFRLPRTKRQLRSFLGAASYYRRFVKHFSNHSGLLSPATSKLAPSVVKWSEDMLEAFNFLKGALVNVCVLTIPSQEDCFSLHTDASGLGIGATLNVVRKGEELPVAYYSKQLQGAQKHYSATELEGLAVFKAVNFFDHFLYGQHFTILTDHSALVYLLKSKRLNKRLYGWMLRLLDFSFTIEYKPGRLNQDADGLSRQAWSSETEELEMEQPRREEQPRAAGNLVGGDVGMSPTEGREG